MQNRSRSRIAGQAQMANKVDVGRRNVRGCHQSTRFEEIYCLKIDSRPLIEMGLIAFHIDNFKRLYTPARGIHLN